MKTTLSRFIETAFNLFDVTGDGHINAKVFILMMVMKMMVVKMMVVKVLLMKILFLGVCLCEQQAGRQGLKPKYNYLVSPNQTKLDPTKPKPQRNTPYGKLVWS